MAEDDDEVIGEGAIGTKLVLWAVGFANVTVLVECVEGETVVVVGVVVSFRSEGLGNINTWPVFEGPDVVRNVVCDRLELVVVVIVSGVAFPLIAEVGTITLCANCDGWPIEAIALTLVLGAIGLKGTNLLDEKVGAEDTCCTACADDMGTTRISCMGFTSVDWVIALLIAIFGWVGAGARARWGDLAANMGWDLRGSTLVAGAIGVTLVGAFTGDNIMTCCGWLDVMPVKVLVTVCVTGLNSTFPGGATLVFCAKFTTVVEFKPVDCFDGENTICCPWEV